MTVDTDPVEPTFAEGRAAFLAGKPDTDNPYPRAAGNSAHRIHWFDGYLGARTDAFLERLEERTCDARTVAARPETIAEEIDVDADAKEAEDNG